jgi:hypothetical protein
LYTDSSGHKFVSLNNKLDVKQRMCIEFFK